MTQIYPMNMTQKQWAMTALNRLDITAQASIQTNVLLANLNANMNRGFVVVSNQLADIANSQRETNRLLGDIAVGVQNIEAALESISELLKNPASTAAAELRDRGIRGIQSGWFDDALSDLDESLKLDRYDYVAHYYRGIANLKSQDIRSAKNAMYSVLKYAMPPNLDGKQLLPQAYGCLAALQLHSFAVSEGQQSTGVEILRRVVGATAQHVNLRAGWTGAGRRLAKGQPPLFQADRTWARQQIDSAGLLLAIIENDAESLAKFFSLDFSTLFDAANSGVSATVLDRASDLAVERHYSVYWNHVFDSGPKKFIPAVKPDPSLRGQLRLLSFVSALSESIQKVTDEEFPKMRKFDKVSAGFATLFSITDSFTGGNGGANQMASNAKVLAAWEEKRQKWFAHIDRTPIARAWIFLKSKPLDLSDITVI